MSPLVYLVIGLIGGGFIVAMIVLILRRGSDNGVSTVLAKRLEMIDRGLRDGAINTEVRSDTPDELRRQESRDDGREVYGHGTTPVPPCRYALTLWSHGQLNLDTGCIMPLFTPLRRRTRFAGPRLPRAEPFWASSFIVCSV